MAPLVHNWKLVGSPSRKSPHTENFCTPLSACPWVLRYSLLRSRKLCSVWSLTPHKDTTAIEGAERLQAVLEQTGLSVCLCLFTPFHVPVIVITLSSLQLKLTLISSKELQVVKSHPDVLTCSLHASIRPGALTVVPMEPCSWLRSVVLIENGSAEQQD